MRLSRSWCLGFLVLVANHAVAAEPRGRIIEDIWNVAYLQGAKAGSVHTVVREIEQAGKKILRTTTALKMTLRRDGREFKIQMENGSDETADGKVTGVWLLQDNGELGKVIMKGTVADGKLDMQVTGSTQYNKQNPWNDEVLGLYRQETMFRDRKVKPGDTFTFLSFEPMVSMVATNRVTVKDFEKVEVQGRPRRLLRVEIQPDKIVASNGAVQLPTLTMWLDDKLLPVRSQAPMPPLGDMVLYRSAGPVAANAGPGAEILEASFIPLNRSIAPSISARSAVYRITVKGNKEPAAAFAPDARQTARNARGDAFEMAVKALPPAHPSGKAAEPGEEYVKSCYWLDSDDLRIKKLAREAVGDEPDLWKKAQRVQRWVKNNLDNSYGVAFIPASEVAKIKRGDCRQHSMLATAMCRAEGIPARPVLGLVYGYNKQRRPIMAFHMWTEVWRDGQWYPLDATLGHVGATHIKIAANSWHNEQSLTPLLDIWAVMGKLSIEVISVDEGE